MTSLTIDPPDGVRILRAGKHDVARVQSLLHALDRHLMEAGPDMFVPNPGGSRDEARLEGILDSSDAAIFLAVSGDEAVGLAVFVGRSIPAVCAPEARRIVDLDMLVVRERWRHQSITHSLIAAGRQFARALGAQAMTVGVQALNVPALRCYEAAGFSPVMHRLEAPIEAA